MKSKGNISLQHFGYLLAFLAVFSWQYLSAVNVDSMKRLLQGDVRDTAYVKTCIDLSAHFEKVDLDSAHRYALMAVKRAEQSGLKFWQAEAYNSIGIVEDFRGNYENALAYYDKAYQIYSDLNRARKKVIVLVNKGVVHRIIGNDDSAENYYSIALNLAEEEQLDRLQSYILNNLGSIYYNRGELLKAVDYTIRSLRIKEKRGDEIGALYSIYNLGNFYYELKSADKALGYFNLALKKSYLIGDSMWMADCYYGLGLVYQNLLEKPDSAHDWLLKSYNLRKEAGYKEGIAESANALGEIYLEKGEIDVAEEYLREGLETSLFTKNSETSWLGFFNLSQLELKKGEMVRAGDLADSALHYARKVDLPKPLSKVYYLQMQIHREQGDLETAIQYYDQYKALDDSLFSAETSRQIAELESLYQLEKKDKELLAADMKMKERDDKLNRQRRQMMILGGGGFALVLILFLLVRNNRSRRKLQAEEISNLKRQKEIQSLKAMISGEEKERTRIAKELHDGVSGLLSTVKLYFSSLSKSNDKLEKDETFLKAKELLNESSSEIRKVAHNLMPEILLKEGLPVALASFCENIRGSKMLDIYFEAINMEERIPASVELMVYRIVQELINNIIKHANATEAFVQVSRHQEILQVTVEDNGTGFQKNEDDGVGLDSIRNRLDLLDGKLNIESSSEMGTSINIEIYLTKKTPMK